MSRKSKPKQNTAPSQKDEIVLSSKSTSSEQVPQQTFALQQQALRIAQAMQTTLDVYALVKKFSQELKNYVEFCSFQFAHEQTEHLYQEGITSPYRLRYRLTIEQETLGEVVLSHDREFNQETLIQVENALSGLVYPLRNALNYHLATLKALTDPLTQLGNRHAYNVAMQREMDFSKRHQAPLSLLLLDLDKFKEINDTFGHNAGDHTLVWFGSILADVCRNSDLVFRLGGDEFIIILMADDLGASHLAERLLQEVQKREILWNQQTLTVGLSIGISTLKAEDTLETLFDRADLALYQAKKQGGHSSKKIA